MQAEKEGGRLVPPEGAEGLAHDHVDLPTASAVLNEGVLAFRNATEQWHAVKFV